MPADYTGHAGSGLLFLSNTGSHRVRPLGVVEVSKKSVFSELYGGTSDERPLDGWRYSLDVDPGAASASLSALDSALAATSPSCNLQIQRDRERPNRARPVVLVEEDGFRALRRNFGRAIT